MESLLQFGKRVVSFLTLRGETWVMRLALHLTTLLSPSFRSTVDATWNLIRNPQLVTGDPDHAADCSRMAVDQFRNQKQAIIPPVYQPGATWGKTLEGLETYRQWRETGSDAVLEEALRKFYRTDLITGHSGDFYVRDIEDGSVNISFQVFMVLVRFRGIAREGLRFPPACISTTDVGQNIYVPYLGQKLTFKIMRHAHYVNRMMELGLLEDTGMIVGELGPGAGELTLMTRRVLPRVKYVCFDLPETLLIATYNILATCPGLRVGLSSDFPGNGPISREELERFDIVLLPNWFIGRLEDGVLDLFVNIGSLSEMDRPIIENYLKEIGRICDGSFFMVNRNISVPGSDDIPVDEFPFPPGATLVSKRYDQAADRYHVRYGLNYRTNYWECIYRLHGR